MNGRQRAVHGDYAALATTARLGRHWRMVLHEVEQALLPRVGQQRLWHALHVHGWLPDAQVRGRSSRSPAWLAWLV